MQIITIAYGRKVEVPSLSFRSQIKETVTQPYLRMVIMALSSF
jgi:hypothetical protein